MRVNNSRPDSNAPIPANGPTKVKAAALKPADQSPHSGNSDRVTLSRLTQTLTNMDEARIEKLRAAVSSGNYSVSSHDVSSDILNEHIANSGKRL